MKKSSKYGIPSLKREFPTDEACLNFIYDSLHSRLCSCGGTYSLLKGRRQFQCSNCRFQIAPCIGTIFEKSPTPLTLWFHAVLVFSNAKSGISSKQMQRELEVTYKCAYRMLKMVRESLSDNGDLLKGDVEVDSSVFGGKSYGGKYNKYQKQMLNNKSIAIAALERGGRARVKVIPADNTQVQTDFVIDNINMKGTRLLTDKTSRLVRVHRMGYDRHSVNHTKREYARGDIHINTVETWWAHVKRSILGTHKNVSKRYLQSYLDAFAWHYGMRHNDRRRFEVLIGAVLRPSK
ncbi:MAG: ISSpo3, transposase [Parcubacteria bacterium C7867-005]|nr:MAG: ISSpo3, transposase [Parcubacteria bacterium C7867-005]